MKKIVSLVMVMVMSLSLGIIPVDAKEKGKVEKFEDVGVPTELVEIMPKEQKDDILKNNLRFLSYKKVSFEDLDKVDSVSSDDMILPRGTIPSSDLDFYIAIYYSDPTYNDSVRKIRLYVNYNWHVVPNFTLTDPFGVAWDQTLWRPVDNTAYNQTFWKLEDGTTQSESDNVLAYSDVNGAGWNTDIKYAIGLKYVLDNYGWGAITLEAINPSASVTTQFHANYTHIYSPGSIGLSFYGINVSYTGSASADTRGVFETLSY